MEKKIETRFQGRYCFYKCLGNLGNFQIHGQVQKITIGSCQSISFIFLSVILSSTVLLSLQKLPIS